MIFEDLQPFSFKHEPKMSRGALGFMLQMYTVQLKALLNAACNVDNTCTFSLGGYLNLLNDGCLQCCKGCPGRCCL